MPPEKLKDQIESKLKDYIKKFVRYSGFAHLTSERKQIIAGTFAYLLEDNDMIPDDVPNIGLLDDLMVFVEAARHFLATGAPIAGVCNPEEVLEDIDFVQRHIGLMFGNQHFSIDVIKKLGEKNLHHLSELSAKIQKKYIQLGDFNTE